MSADLDLVITEDKEQDVPLLETHSAWQSYGERLRSTIGASTSEWCPKDIEQLLAAYALPRRPIERLFDGLMRCAGMMESCREQLVAETLDRPMTDHAKHVHRDALMISFFLNLQRISIAFFDVQLGDVVPPSDEKDALDSARQRFIDAISVSDRKTLESHPFFLECKEDWPQRLQQWYFPHSARTVSGGFGASSERLNALTQQAKHLINVVLRRIVFGSLASQGSSPS